MDNLKAGDSIKLRTLSKLSDSGKSGDEFGNVLFRHLCGLQFFDESICFQSSFSLALCKKELILIHLLE